MKQRILLTLVTLFALLTGANAESPYGLQICGVDVTDENKANLIAVINSVDGCSATGTMSYDSETQTLNLNGVTASADKKIINTTQPLTIQSEGTNTLSSSAIIIYGDGSESLTITGSGSLTAKHTGSETVFYHLNKSAMAGCKLVIDHTTVDFQDEKGINVVYTSLSVIESTLKVYSISNIRWITLTNSSIQSPEGARISNGAWSSSAIKCGDEIATNIVIVPDTRAEPGLKWKAADDWDNTIRTTWNDPYFPDVLAFYYPQEVSPAVLVNKYNVAVQYESTNPEAIQIDATTGAIKVVKAGTATITASFAGNTEYKPAKVSYTYSCNKGRPVFSFAESSYKATVGEDFTSPVPSIKNILNEEVTGFALAYESSDETVATVNEKGIITPLKKGETTITVWLAENDFYEGGTGWNDPKGTYTLTVVDPGTTTLQFPEKEYRVAVNGTFTAPQLTNPDNVPVTYSSSNTEVAEVNASTGAVTLHKAGTAIITAAFAGNDDFKAASVSYTLIVQKISAAISFPQQEYTVSTKEAFEAPKASTTPEGLTLTYSSSDETVAKVDAKTGAVTILKIGETTISAEFAGNDIYNAVSGSYKLTVVKADVELSFPQQTYTATYGEPFSAPTLKNDSKLEVTYSSSNTKVATVDAKTGAVTILAAGKTTITAEFAGNEQYEATKASYELTVESETINKEEPVTVDGETLYKPSAEVAEAIKNSVANEIALSEEAAARLTVGADGSITFSEGADVKMAILGVEAGKVVTCTFEGTIEAEGLTEPAASRRAALTLVSGKEYVATGGDILLTLKTSEAPVTLLKVTVANATGIQLINADGTTAKRYNLRGQRVDESYKGIVIINGKKMLVK